MLPFGAGSWGLNPELSVTSLVIDRPGLVTLEPGRDYWVTNASARLILPDWADRLITIRNKTGAALDFTSRSRRLDIGGMAGRIPIDGVGYVIATVDRWLTMGVVASSLTFTYNGTPLASNSSNPYGASGLFHYLGIIQGGGTWVNPSNTPILVAATNSSMAGTIENLTDRVSGGQNVHSNDIPNSWFAWQFANSFRCTGFTLQTRGLDTNHLPRQFEIRVNTGTGLNSSTNVASWALVQSWSTPQITAMNTYHYFSIGTPVPGNQIAIRQTALNASGNHFLGAQEFELYGLYG